MKNVGSLGPVVPLGVVPLILAAAIAGCSVPAGETQAQQQDTAMVTHKMVGGTVSSSAQDETVYLNLGQGSCTGSLIAPNLVLTARHCVATPNQGASECVAYGPTVAASSVSIVLGVDASPTKPAAARGTKITVPQTSNMCGFDVALVQLDRPLTGAKIAKLRFTELAPNEPTTAVGYGVDGNDNTLTSRMQRTTSVLGVGPLAITYKTKTNTSVPYQIPAGDIATGESTCYGDSGGPLFDAQGRVVAITSRGIDAPGTNPQNHGNGCIDLPSVYAGVRFNEKLIRDAATAAGHPLPVGEPTEPGEKPNGRPGDVDPQDDEGSDDEFGEGDETSGGEEEEEEVTPKKKKRSLGNTPSAGCSASSSSSSSSTPPWTMLIVAGAVIVAASRRRKTKRS